MAYTKYSLTPANNNAAPPDGAPEGMLPSAVNDTMRDMMAQIRDVGDGIRNGTYTMTAPVITGGSITGVALSGNTFTNPVITGGSINNTPIGASTASTGAFTTLSASGAFSANGGATLGDASGDALTINSSAVSIPNGLNFDSNTFVIDATNNRVGVGTASPASGYSLEVSGSGIRNTATNPYIDLYASGQATDSKWWRTGGGGANFTITAINDAGTGADTALTITRSSQLIDSIRFSTNSSERMRITSTGNVGIGTSSPNAPLSFAASTGQKIRFFTTLSGYSIGVESSEFRFVTDSGAIFSWRNGTDYSTATEYMRLNSSGNLGLGVTPSAWGASKFVMQLGARASLYGANNLTILGNNYYDDGTNNRYIATAAASDYYQSAGSHVWRTAPSGTAGNTITFTQAMTLDASGNLGIGTSNPASGRALTLDSSSNYFGIRFQTSGSNIAQLIQESTGILYIDVGMNANSAAAHVFRNNSTERMRITSGGRLLVGTTSENTSGGVLQVSNGITFPATQSASSDANTLDDYEEGTWTPSFASTGGGESLTYTGQRTGRYTKIGRVVYFQFDIELSAKSGGSGTARITGFPFTAENAPVTGGGTSIYWAATTTYSPGFGNIVLNTTVMDIRTDVTTDSSLFPWANITSTTRLLMFGFYTVA